MHKDFWLERWQRGEIGFHQGEVNPYLQRYWHELQAKPGDEVFVPLCGKSLDMVWLREQGCYVLGVELSPLAVQDFFREQGLAAEPVSGDRFENYRGSGYCLACGDFFDLNKKDMREVRAVYDRASLVALPPALRARYARHLAAILPSGARVLLVTFDYPQAEMSGPPFSVSEEEVRALYEPYAEVRLLASQDVLAENARFKQRGVTRLEERIFLLTLR